MNEEEFLKLKLKELRLQESLLKMDKSRKEELIFLQEKIKKIRKEYAKISIEKMKNEEEGKKIC